MLRRTSTSLSSWRDAGLSYVKYLVLANETLHRAVKDTRQAKYVRYSAPGYFAQDPDGQGGFQKRTKVAADPKDF